MPENRLVIGREEILRPPPRALAFDHRVDGDIADTELFHFLSLPFVIASEAKQSRSHKARLDCFVARAPRNDGEQAATHRPHPEEPRSGVSKDGRKRVCGHPSRRRARARLLRMRVSCVTAACSAAPPRSRAPWHPAAPAFLA